MNYFVQFTILCMYFDIFLPTTLVFMLSLYVLSVRWYVLNMWYMNFDVYIFFMICHDFFIIFLAFYVAFCVYRPSPIRVAETDPSRCRPSRRPRPRLWTMLRRGCGLLAILQILSRSSWNLVWSHDSLLLGGSITTINDAEGTRDRVSENMQCSNWLKTMV